MALSWIDAVLDGQVARLRDRKLYGLEGMTVDKSGLNADELSAVSLAVIEAEYDPPLVACGHAVDLERLHHAGISVLPVFHLARPDMIVAGKRGARCQTQREAGQ